MTDAPEQQQWPNLATNPDGSPRLLFQDHVAKVEGTRDPGAAPVPDNRKPIRSASRPQSDAEIAAERAEQAALEAEAAAAEAAAVIAAGSQPAVVVIETTSEVVAPIPPQTPLVVPPDLAAIRAASESPPPGSMLPLSGAAAYEFDVPVPPAAPLPQTTPYLTDHRTLTPDAGGIPSSRLEWVDHGDGWVTLLSDVWETVYMPGSTTPSTRLVHSKHSRIPLSTAELARSVV